MTGLAPTNTAAFEELESNIRTYCRSWPVVFDRAVGSWIYDETGRAYLDFFTGAGALSYGHNNPRLQQVMLDYFLSNRIIHSLDMFTAAKREFLTALNEIILRPRGLAYRVQFPGPAGTNAVEAALKLARKVTGRTDVVCFTGGFHGTSLGSLSVTTNLLMRRAAGVPLGHATALPFNEPDFACLDRLLEAPREADRPAAVIVETIQGEGGINLGSPEWLRGVADRCHEHEVPLVVDDVQMGCGRTGPFFSFEIAGIEPDIVCMSKAISGYGMPLALTLIRPDLDIWEPGEHSGTFRGFDPALVTGTAALEAYWKDDRLEARSLLRGRRIASALADLADSVPGQAIGTRGRGMVHGLVLASGELAGSVAAEAFRRGLLVERAGAQDEVVKLMPALTATDEELEQGLMLLADSVEAVCRSGSSRLHPRRCALPPGFPSAA